MATIQDVAAKAGVSVATVSRVINQSNTVAPKSVNKVRKAILELGYQPNFLARDLRRAETNRVLVLLQSISNPYYATIVKGIEDVAQKHNYSIMLCNTDSEITREKTYIDLLGKKVVQGAIFLDTEMTSEEINLLVRDNHIVFCCEYRPGTQVSHVMIDNYSAAKTMVRHLIAQGHKEIALIAGDRHLASTDQRYRGYLDALEEAGLQVRKPWIFWSEESSFKMGIRAVENFLYLKEHPTAVFAMSDILAIGAIRAIHNHGLRVPDDIAVAGFDGIEYSAASVPSLTTMVQPSYDMGGLAMEMLIRKMKDGETQNKEVVLEHELVIRESTSQTAGQGRNR